MLIAIGFIFCAWVFFVLGKKYQDLQDIMLARRVAKLIDTRESLNKEREQFERWAEQEARQASKRKVMTTND